MHYLIFYIVVTYILGQNEAAHMQRTALDDVREYENESDCDSKTVVSDADRHETHKSRGSVSETVLQTESPIPSPSPTLLNEGITPIPAILNDLHGESDEENLFGAVEPMHCAMQ